MKRSTALTLVIAVVAASTLSGCANAPSSPNSMMADTFGNALHEDLALQVTDTDPAVLAAPPPASSGDRAALAETRYKQGKVITPVGQNTATVADGGGGGGGGGGGSGGGSGP